MTTPHTAPASAPPAEGRLIVVFATKGGVGKTVVAINLAAGLAQRLKQPVCLVNGDVAAAGDLAKALSLPASRSVIDLIPSLKRVVLANGDRFQPAPPDHLVLTPAMFPLTGTVMPHASGLHVLECLARPDQLDQLDPTVLPTLFHILTRRYRYVVVDGGGVFSEALTPTFDAAHLILLVTTPDAAAIYQAKWALGVIERLAFPSLMVKAVLNRADSRGSINTPDVRLALPCDVLGEIPRIRVPERLV